MKTLFCTLLLAMLGTVAAKADTVTITFDQPMQSAAPGQTAEFMGTIVNDSSSTIFLNADSLNLDGLSFTVNDNFFTNAPISLAAGASSGDIDLFDVTVSDPLMDAAGVYLGSYTVQGGGDGGTQDNLGTTQFSVNTASSMSPVPEPSSIYLLLSGGLAVAAPLVRKMRKS